MVEKLFEQRGGISLLECVELCMHSDLVEEWGRLSGKNLLATNTFDRLIDEATSYDMAVMQEFVEFVYTYVFCTYPEHKHTRG